VATNPSTCSYAGIVEPLKSSLSLAGCFVPSLGFSTNPATSVSPPFR